LITQDLKMAFVKTLFSMLCLMLTVQVTAAGLLQSKMRASNDAGSRTYQDLNLNFKINLSPVQQDGSYIVQGLATKAGTDNPSEELKTKAKDLFDLARREAEGKENGGNAVSLMLKAIKELDTGAYHAQIEKLSGGKRNFWASIFH